MKIYCSYVQSCASSSILAMIYPTTNAYIQEPWQQNLRESKWGHLPLLYQNISMYLFYIGYWLCFQFRLIQQFRLIHPSLPLIMLWLIKTCYIAFLVSKSKNKTKPVDISLTHIHATYNIPWKCKGKAVRGWCNHPQMQWKLSYIILYHIISSYSQLLLLTFYLTNTCNVLTYIQNL